MTDETAQGNSKAELVAMEWARAQSAVFSYIRSQVRHYHDAEDLLQRVAAVVVQKQEQYDSDRPFIAWAIGLARYEVYRHRDETGRDKLVFSETLEERIADSYLRQADHLLSMRKTLSTCIDKLSGRGRKVIELHYLRSESGANIAQLLGMTPNAVFVLLHRVRNALRQCVETQLRREA